MRAVTYMTSLSQQASHIKSLCPFATMIDETTTIDDEIEAPTEEHHSLVEGYSEFQIFVLKMDEERSKFAELCYEYWSDEFQSYRNQALVFGVIEASFPQIFMTPREKKVINRHLLNQLYRKYQRVSLTDIQDEEIRENLRFARENRHVLF